MYTPVAYPWQMLFEAFPGCSNLDCSFRGSCRPSLSSVLAAGIPLSVCGNLDLQDIAGVPADIIIGWLTSPEQHDRSLTIDSVDEHVNALITRLVERRGEFRQVKSYRDIKLRLLYSWRNDSTIMDMLNAYMGPSIDRYYTYDDSPSHHNADKIVLKMANRFLLFTIVVCSRPMLFPYDN